MTSALCTVNTIATINGVNVSAASTINFALADVSGVTQWALTCIGTDELQVPATVSAAISINQTTKTATLTAPTLGTALVFQSVVNNGRDVNGNVVPAYTVTFGVFILTTGGLRVAAVNETTEGDSVYGWTSKINAILRSGGGGTTYTGTAPIVVTGSVISITTAAAPTANTVAKRDASGNLQAAAFDSGAAADLPIQRNGTTIFTVTTSGISFPVALTSTSIGQLPRTSDAACSDMMFTAQSPFASATTTNRNPGNFIFNAAAPTNSGTTEPHLTFTRGGQLYFAVGKLDTGAYGTIWCGPITPSTTNYSFLSDGSTATTVNGPSGGTLYLALGGGVAASTTAALWSFATSTVQITAGQLQLKTASTASALTTNIDFSTGNIQAISMGTNITSLTFTNLKAGAVYTIGFAQDATGSRLLTKPTTMKTTGATFTLTTTASKTDTITMFSDGTNLIEICRATNIS